MECEVCYQYYKSDDPSKTPIILDCAHTFCKACVCELLFTHPKCPICRNTITKQFDDLKPNFALLTILNSRKLKLSSCSQNDHPTFDDKKLLPEMPAINAKMFQMLKILGPYSEKLNDPETKNLQIEGPFQFKNGDVYLGQMKNGLREGLGTQIYSNGSRYDGIWRNDAPNGQGRIIYENGDFYEGFWKNGVKQGQGKCHFADMDVCPLMSRKRKPNPEMAKPISRMPRITNEKTLFTLNKIGEYVYPKDHSNTYSDCIYLQPHEFESGAAYDGQWKFGLRHGKGKLIWKDGSIYDGFWENNKANGKGRLIYADGDFYDGDWKDGKRNGKGEFVHMDGTKYKGFWSEDNQHGYGKVTWPDGAQFSGEFIFGKKNGKGKFLWEDKSNYEGQLVNDQIHGEGIYKWNDGRVYIGEWKNNKMDGKGVYLWADGKRYAGEYKEDKKEGYGVLEWPDGRKFEGYWLNGKKQRRGSYQNKSVETKRKLVKGKKQ